MASQDSEPTYVRLLNLLGAIRELSPFQNLTADEEQLLGQLAVRWHESDKITVGELMQAADKVSPSTIYRRLIGLRDKGFIDMPTDKKDRRIRFVVPLAPARKYTRHLDKCVLELAADRSQSL